MERIKTLLIANRGEVRPNADPATIDPTELTSDYCPPQIAVRTIKTAKQLGIKTIAIYTPADAASLHVSQADEAVLLPGSNSTAYTEGDEIIKIAKDKGADAIIPGYGFLSENADFARSIGEAGMVWVGPSPESIEGMSYCRQGLYSY